MRAELVARLAGRQHGVVARRQLHAIGLSASAVGRWAVEGQLHRVHRGVYAVGHPVLTVNGRRMAAVLAAGPGAVLSFVSAAALWELRATSATRIDVTVRTKGGRARQGLRIHRTPTLQTDEVTNHQGIPSPPRRAPCSTSPPPSPAAPSSERSTRPRCKGSTT